MGLHCTFKQTYTYERILQVRIDLWISDNFGATGQCRRLSSVILDIQRCSVQRAYDGSYHRWLHWAFLYQGPCRNSRLWASEQDLRGVTASIGLQVILSTGIKKELTNIVEWILAQGKNLAHTTSTSTVMERDWLWDSQAADQKRCTQSREKLWETVQGIHQWSVHQAYHQKRILKFLSISKDVQVTINEQEIENDSKWDGLKGPQFGIRNSL